MEEGRKRGGKGDILAEGDIELIKLKVVEGGRLDIKRG